ncbi:DNA-binding protein HU [Clostridia bacterium]|nr:DNA-binding protein HU [Clostridia bacterium]
MSSKADFIAKVAEKSGLTKKDATTAFNTIFEEITAELSNGGSLQILGFGTFDTITRSARQARNLQTGETIDVPEKQAARFRVGKKLKESVAGKPKKEAKPAAKPKKSKK